MQPAREIRTQRQPTVTCRSQPAHAMRKVLVSLLTINAGNSAAAWSPRDAHSALRVAWEGPGTRGCPAVAADAKALPEENAAEGRGLVQMVSGAVLLFLIGGMPFVLTAMHTVSSFAYTDRLVLDSEEDALPEPLDVIFEQEVAPPDPLPNPEPSPDAVFLDRLHAWNRRNLTRQKIWIEWLQEEIAVLGVEEYDPAPIPYCKRSPYYEGPGFEVPLSELDADSDAD